MGEFTGILNVNKPQGWTSHDVVARVRRLASQKRVGHAGTLDPMATGVLPVLLGRATRLADFIQTGRKSYRATVVLGSATDTDDAEGSVISTAPVRPLSADIVREALGRFEGDILQIPPAYSALKVGGRRAYAVARRGEAVDLAARPITIHAMCLISFSSHELQLDITCSKGTYVRALARDLAVALGTVGHLTALVRTQVGPFSIDDTLTLDEIAERGVASSLLPANTAIQEAPSVTLESPDAARLINGQPIEWMALCADCVWVYDPSGRLIALASADGALLRPRLAL